MPNIPKAGSLFKKISKMKKDPEFKISDPGPFSKRSQKPKGTWNSELLVPNIPKSGSLFKKISKNQKGPRIQNFQCPIFQNPGPFSKKSQKPKGTWNSELSVPNIPKSGSLSKKIKLVLVVLVSANSIWLAPTILWYG